MNATVPSYGGLSGCQPLAFGIPDPPGNVSVLITGKVLQAAALAYLGVSYVLTLPASPRGRDLAIAAGVFLLGWFLVKDGKGKA